MKSIWNPNPRTPDGNAETLYRPGTVAPRTGLYWVSHLRHRLTHSVFVEEGTKFPNCRRCGVGVRFHLHLRAHHIESDRDFTRRSKILTIDSRKAS